MVRSRTSPREAPAYADAQPPICSPKFRENLQVDNPFTYDVLQQVAYLMLELRPSSLPSSMVSGNTQSLLAPESAIHVGAWPPLAGTVLSQGFVGFWWFWFDPLLFASFGLFGRARILISVVVLTLCSYGKRRGRMDPSNLSNPSVACLHISQLPMRHALSR